ncbi:MAG: uracil-DNA glycosylase [Elusimicrobiota bacterium]
MNPGVIELAKKYFMQKMQLGIKEIYLPETLNKYPEKKIDKEEPVKSLDRLYAEYHLCQNCRLGRSRKNFVFGEGDPGASLMFIGEAPGYDEDVAGRPFVGKAGMLLDKIINAMGLRRKEVYIANILKCRPPDNRDPSPIEAESCMPILIKQIQIIKPKFICLLGRIAAHHILEINDSVNRLRGKFYDFKGAKAMVTYHPAALLRHESWKKQTWEDIKSLMNIMGLKIPEKKN